MFQQFIAALFVSMFALIGQSHAEEQTTDFEFSVVSMKDTLNEDKKINSSDLGNGVFVTVTSGWTPYPKTAQLVKEILISKGIKVVDSPAEADVGLQFRSDTLDLSEIENNEDAGINKEQLAAAVIGAFATGGASLIGEMWHPSTSGKPIRGLMGVGIATAPKVSGRGTLSGNDLMFVGTDMVFQSNKEGHEVTRAAFVSFVIHFVNAHFVVSPSTKTADISPSVK